MRSRLPRHKGDGWPSCFYPPPLAAVKRPPGRAGVSRKHSVLMSKRACRGTPCPQCRLRAELFGKAAGRFSVQRSGLVKSSNPISFGYCIPLTAICDTENRVRQPCLTRFFTYCFTFHAWARRSSTVPSSSYHRHFTAQSGNQSERSNAMITRQRQAKSPASRP